jgi:hypothetical protein
LQSALGYVGEAALNFLFDIEGLHFYMDTEGRNADRVSLAEPDGF